MDYKHTYDTKFTCYFTKTGTITGSGTTAIGPTTTNESGTLNYTGSGGFSLMHFSNG